MPLAAAIDCQSVLPEAEAIDCREDPAVACASGRVPTGLLPGPAPGGGAAFFAKANSVMRCWDNDSVTLARCGMPSGEKNSRLSSIESIIPSKLNEPQINLTIGGKNLESSSGSF